MGRDGQRLILPATPSVPEPHHSRNHHQAWITPNCLRTIISPPISISLKASIGQASSPRDYWRPIRDAASIQAGGTHQRLRSKPGRTSQAEHEQAELLEGVRLVSRRSQRPCRAETPVAPQIPGTTAPCGSHESQGPLFPRGQGAQGPFISMGTAPTVVIFSPLPGATTRWNLFPCESRCGIPALVRAPSAACRPGRSTDCRSRAHGF